MNVWIHSKMSAVPSSAPQQLAAMIGIMMISSNTKKERIVGIYCYRRMILLTLLQQGGKGVGGLLSAEVNGSVVSVTLVS